MREETLSTVPRLPAARPWFQSGRFLLLLLVLAAIYTYGWRVTRIDIPALVNGVRFVEPFVRDLVRPDILERPVQRTTAQAAVTTDPAVPPERLPPPGSGAPQLHLDRAVTPVGSRVTVRGAGFPAGAQGTLYWVNRIGNRVPVGTFRTDAQGAFALTVTVPEVFSGPGAGARGAQQRVVAEVVRAMGPLRPSRTLLIVLDKIVETVFLALMGTTFAVIVALPLSFLGARNLMYRHPVGRLVYYAMRTFFNVMRSIEPLILAIVFSVWVGLGPFAGVLALALHSIAALGKLYSEQIESIDPGPIEAITATGASALQVVRYAVIPQVVPPFIAFTIYRWDINVRLSTVIGFVGGGGIGFILQQYINLLQYRQAATAVWAIAIVVAAMDYLSAVVRERVV